MPRRLKPKRGGNAPVSRGKKDITKRQPSLAGSARDSDQSTANGFNSKARSQSIEAMKEQVSQLEQETRRDKTPKQKMKQPDRNQHQDKRNLLNGDEETKRRQRIANGMMTREDYLEELKSPDSEVQRKESNEIENLVWEIHIIKEEIEHIESIHIQIQAIESRIEEQKAEERALADKEHERLLDAYYRYEQELQERLMQLERERMLESQAALERQLADLFKQIDFLDKKLEGLHQRSSELDRIIDQSLKQVRDGFNDKRMQQTLDKAPIRLASTSDDAPMIPKEHLIDPQRDIANEFLVRAKRVGDRIHHNVQKHLGKLEKSIEEIKHGASKENTRENLETPPKTEARSEQRENTDAALKSEQGATAPHQEAEQAPVSNLVNVSEDDIKNLLYNAIKDCARDDLENQLKTIVKGEHLQKSVDALLNSEQGKTALQDAVSKVSEKAKEMQLDGQMNVLTSSMGEKREVENKIVEVTKERDQKTAEYNTISNEQEKNYELGEKQKNHYQLPEPKSRESHRVMNDRVKEGRHRSSNSNRETVQLKRKKLKKNENMAESLFKRS